MKILNMKLITGILMAGLFIILGCEKNENKGNVTNISSYNSDESHKSGQNCMNCHKSGGDGEGWFLIAGSVYDEGMENSFPNATIKLYTKNNGAGSLVKTIEADALGNFYTTENIDFSSGLYPTVSGNSKNEYYMNSAITTGQCASCHGNTTEKIWTN